MSKQDKEWRWRYYQEIEASVEDVRVERAPSSSYPLNLQIARGKIDEDRQGFLTTRIEWDNTLVRKLDELEIKLREAKQIQELRKRDKRRRRDAALGFVRGY